MIIKIIPAIGVGILSTLSLGIYGVYSYRFLRAKKIEYLTQAILAGHKNSPTGEDSIAEKSTQHSTANKIQNSPRFSTILHNNDNTDNKDLHKNPQKTKEAKQSTAENNGEKTLTLEQALKDFKKILATGDPLKVNDFVTKHSKEIKTIKDQFYDAIIDDQKQLKILEKKHPIISEWVSKQINEAKIHLSEAVAEKNQKLAITLISECPVLYTTSPELIKETFKLPEDPDSPSLSNWRIMTHPYGLEGEQQVGPYRDVIQHGTIDDLNKFIDEGNDLNIDITHGFTILTAHLNDEIYYESRENNDENHKIRLQKIELLLKNGAQVFNPIYKNAIYAFMHPLITPLNKQTYDILNLLIDHMNVNSRRLYSSSVLCTITETWFKPELEVQEKELLMLLISKLISKGATLRKQDFDSLNKLDSAHQSSLKDFFRENNIIFRYTN